jgi:hypothetical protein
MSNQVSVSLYYAICLLHDDSGVAVTKTAPIILLSVDFPNKKLSELLFFD